MLSQSYHVLLTVIMSYIEQDTQDGQHTSKDDMSRTGFFHFALFLFHWAKRQAVLANTQCAETTNEKHVMY